VHPSAPPRDPRELRFIDCADTLQQLQQFAVAHRWLVPVFVKIDAGNKRAGVPDAAAYDLVAEVHELGKGRDVGVQLLGIYSHSGHAYACTCAAEALECAADECRRMGELCERLEKAGIQVPVISVGSVRQPLYPNPQHARAVTLAADADCLRVVRRWRAAAAGLGHAPRLNTFPPPRRPVIAAAAARSCSRRAQWAGAAPSADDWAQGTTCSTTGSR
jgi:D-serine deaminase-like pyridoxal phosphate-dependent protein